MCKLCNGTHVIHTAGSSMAFVRTCPTCGPKSKDQLAAERQKNIRRLVEAKARFGMGVESA